MLPFHQPVKDDFESVNQLIIDQLHSNVGLVENIGHYLIEAGGKRLRPLLVLLTTNALNYKKNYDPANQLKLAAIIEFIHTATLLHDDVVDISSLRRGRLTANAKWGNAPSVLVGDFLYSRAFQLMVDVGDMSIMKILADTTNIISEGEVQQLVNAKNPDISEDDYYQVIYKKTAILFSAACEAGAVISGANDSQRKAFKEYGYHVGMAFQLVDDALDYDGDAETLGKNVGDDLAEGKATLPLIISMQKAPKDEAHIIAEALRNGSIDQIDKVVSIVREHNGLTLTMDKAKSHIDSAIAQLDILFDDETKTSNHSSQEQNTYSVASNDYSKAMKDLALFSISRSY